MTSEQVDEWISDAEAMLEVKLNEAEEHRYRNGLPSLSMGSGALLECLADVRLRLDAVEVLLSEVSRFRTGARVVFKRSTARVDDKWAERVAGGGATSRRKGTFTGSGEVEGPRERYARADVAVMGDRIVMRQRERVLDAADDAVRGLERVYKGLESVRFDLHAMLRLFSVEHRLERTDG